MKQLNPQTKEILQNPIYLVASVVVIALLSVYLFLPWWVAGLVALVWGSWLIQQSFQQGERNRASEQPFASYQEQAQAYKDSIHQIIQANGNSHNRPRLVQLQNRLDTCTQAIETLITRLGHLRQDDLIRQDLAVVPAAIARLETQLNAASDQDTAARLEQVLTIRRNQLGLLQRLQLVAGQTELQIEHTISLLGTIYSQLLIGQSTNEIADYDRLTANIDEEVKRLEDHLEALQEVKGRYGYGLKVVPLPGGQTNAAPIPLESDTLP
jgi:hypothetical protein